MAKLDRHLYMDFNNIKALPNFIAYYRKIIRIPNIFYRSMIAPVTDLLRKANIKTNNNLMAFSDSS